MSSNQSRDPLFYIIQPKIILPKGNMQDKCIVKKTEPVLETPLLEENAIVVQEDRQSMEKLENKNKERTNPLEKKELQPIDVQNVINEYNEKFQTEDKEQSPFSTRKQHSYTMKRVKGFIEMDTMERINYLMHFPRQIPPVPCIFVTKNSSVRGFLLNKTEEAIEVKQFNDKTMEILIDDLVSVKMLGLK